MGFGKDGKGAIVREKTTITLGALAANDAAGQDSAVLLDMDFRILKSEFTAVIRGMTSLEGIGLLLYMTQGILTVAEAEAAVEANGPLRLGDKINEELADRWVRLVGTTGAPTVNETERIFQNEQGGSILKINPRWTFRRGRTSSEGGWNWMVYNNGETITTGATVHLMATHYGVWVA